MSRATGAMGEGVTMSSLYQSGKNEVPQNGAGRASPPRAVFMAEDGGSLATRPDSAGSSSALASGQSRRQ